MYAFFISLIILLSAFGFIYTFFIGKNQANLSHEERTDNPVGAMTWWYVAFIVIAHGGVLVYALFRLL